MLDELKSEGAACYSPGRTRELTGAKPSLRAAGSTFDPSTQVAGRTALFGLGRGSLQMATGNKTFHQIPAFAGNW